VHENNCIDIKLKKSGLWINETIKEDVREEAKLEKLEIKSPL